MIIMYNDCCTVFEVLERVHQGCQTFLEKKAKPRLTKSQTGYKKAKLLHKHDI